MFVRKSVAARMPDDGPLRKVDPSQGWLVQRARLREPRKIPPAPAASYSGDPDDAFWIFDREMAEATQHYRAKHIGKKPQLLGFVQEGKTIPQVDRHEQVNLKFLPEKDGVSFTLATSFLSEVEAGSKNLARWTALPVGSPLGHPTAETEIRRITGPFAVTGKNRFELRLNRAWIASDARRNQLWFVASNPGDAAYSGAVQQAMMTVSPNIGGKPQVIDFPQPADLTSARREIPLAAKSDAGLHVRYYVREGPAEIDGGTLKLTAIPPRAKFPVQITVVAWQWGDPQVNTAEPVERTFEVIDRGE
jgi:hypothetical protein